ncbi:MAG: hypothetical protein IPO21_10350 [Bacteroidales bacterium]|nr:hypothetical protein [Bacteroidales bacterium]
MADHTNYILNAAIYMVDYIKYIPHPVNYMADHINYILNAVKYMADYVFYIPRHVFTCLGSVFSKQARCLEYSDEAMMLHQTGCFGYMLKCYFYNYQNIYSNRLICEFDSQNTWNLFLSVGFLVNHKIFYKIRTDVTTSNFGSIDFTSNYLFTLSLKF